jgi:hypothetical protein
MHEQKKQPFTNVEANIWHDAHEPAVLATDIAEPTYPPQDGGKGAWMFLFGACIIEITAWGNHIFL